MKLFNLLSKKGTIIIEVQYLMNTLKDLTFDNIYHEHYNYWSLTSLVNFFNQFGAKIFKLKVSFYQCYPSMLSIINDLFYSKMFL